MTGFELQTFGIASDRSTNWATTTAQVDSELLVTFFCFNLVEFLWLGTAWPRNNKKWQKFMNSDLSPSLTVSLSSSLTEYDKVEE